MVAGLSFEASRKLNKRLIQIMDEMRESFNQQKGTKQDFIHLLWKIPVPRVGYSTLEKTKLKYSITGSLFKKV